MQRLRLRPVRAAGRSGGSAPVRAATVRRRWRCWLRCVPSWLRTPNFMARSWLSRPPKKRCWNWLRTRSTGRSTCRPSMPPVMTRSSNSSWRWRFGSLRAVWRSCSSRFGLMFRRRRNRSRMFLGRLRTRRRLGGVVARVKRGGGGLSAAQDIHAEGIYRALLLREREACARVDPRTLPRFSGGPGGPRTVVETGARSGALLAALEAGEPVQLEGRQLRRWVDLRRDQAFDSFEVRSDDTVTPLGRLEK